MSSETQVTIFVVYPGTAATRFDRAYWIDRHLPMVRSAWQQHGLESIVGYFPDPSPAGTIAIAECRFTSEAALAATLAAPETPSVMADIPNYTDSTPTLLRATPL